MIARMKDYKYFAGIDLSPAHAGLVWLNEDGSVFDWRLVVNTKKYDKFECEHIQSIVQGKDLFDESDNPLPDGPEALVDFQKRRRYKMANLCFYFFWLFPERRQILKDTYVAVEDYAYAAKSSSVTSCAEIGGIVRNDLWRMGMDYVNISPTSLKKFATGSGKADKSDMYGAFLSEGGTYNDFPNMTEELWNLLSRDSKTKGMVGPRTDLMDAWWLAKSLFDMWSG